MKQSSSEPLEEKPFLTEDDFIARFDKFRHGIFKSSLDHWIETGKLSGSFLLEVRSLIKDNSSDELDDWKQVIIMHKDAIYELESQVSSLESELKALRDTLHAKDKENNDLKQIVSAYSDVVHMKDAAILAKDKEFEALREERDKAIEIVKNLADWSRRYPRDRVYTMEKISMDNELIELEERAKAYTLNTEKN